VKPDPAPSSALVAFRPREIPNVWDDVRLQKLWLDVDRRSWRSLAVVGASRSLDTLQLAELIAQLAWRYRGQPSSVCDLRDLGMRLIDYQVREMQAQMDEGTRLVVALRSISENPTAASIARIADATLLCVSLGETDFKGAEATIAAIGRERILGTIVLRPRAAKSPARPNVR
jgi:hypothetical protein